MTDSYQGCPWCQQPNHAAELEAAKLDLQTAIEDSNKASRIIYAMADALNPAAGEHNVDCAKRVKAELESEREKVAKCVDALEKAMYVFEEMDSVSWSRDSDWNGGSYRGARESAIDALKLVRPPTPEATYPSHQEGGR